MKHVYVEKESRYNIFGSLRWELSFHAPWIVMTLVAIVLPVWMSIVSISGISFDLFSPKFSNGVIWAWLINAILVPANVLIMSSDGLDLSIGAVIAFASVVVAELSSSLGLPVAVDCATLFL